MTKKIFVTQPHLPPLEEFIPYLEKIWDSKILTNNGPFHHQLELALCRYLEVEHLSLFTNGTIALVTALQALNISGEVITTPYSFVATTHALLWNKCKPVFVDIANETCNIDPKCIEQAITSKTTAILGVHCYGNPCEVERIQQLADKYSLKIIYDAAHAFGVRYKGHSLLNHGNLSVLSFHATKVFNTFEGGAIICPNAAIKNEIDHLKNFGFSDEVTITAAGINGKMSELNAAFGLLQLKYIDDALEKRRGIERHYRAGLAEVDGISLLPEAPSTIGNSSYFPIFIGPRFPVSRDVLYQTLRNHGIYARRYFFPLISDIPMYRDLPSAQNTPIASNASNSVICLPIYPELDFEIVASIIKIIRSAK